MTGTWFKQAEHNREQGGFAAAVRTD